MSNDVWVVTLPKLGETVTEGEITALLKQVGDTVELDDPLFEVSTDKVDSEIPSPADGVIAEVLVSVGQVVPVGTPVLRISSGPLEVGSGDGSTGPSASAPAAGAPQSAAATPESGGSEGPSTGAAPAGEVHDILLPKLGETVTEGTIGSWLKKVGDQVAFDDALYEVSTDKVDSEIPSPADGVLLEILHEAGATVPVGTVVARIGEPGAAPAATAAPAAAAPSTNGAAKPAATTGAAAGPTQPGRVLSPLVRRLAAEAGLDLGTVTGTGVGGRIRREDVQQAIARGGAGGTTVTPAAPTTSAPVATAAAPAPSTNGASAAAPGDPRDQVVPLSRMRLAVADGMMRSLAESASVWTSVEVDFHNVEQVRIKHKDRFKAETGASLSYLPFVSRAVVDALRAYPAVNSSIDIPNKTMTMHPYVNLGIAVDLDQQGLVVPVVKDADGLNMRGIAQRVTALAGAARKKQLGVGDMKGSTFTITNPGPFGSYASSPIINQPNVAILCTDGVKRRPVAVGDMIAIHPTGIIGLVYDHRAFDGSTASLFLAHIRDSLEQRDWAAEVG